jgi:uncharacterized membrane protein
MKNFAYIVAFSFLAIMFFNAPGARASQPVVEAAISKLKDAGSLALFTSADPTAVPITPLTQPNTNQPVFIQRFMLDPLANSISVIVLIGMLVSLVALAYRFINPPDESSGGVNKMDSGTRNWRDWGIPVLCLLGIGVAGYLSYVEISHNQAICGPIGNCNSVQTSRYATLWGFMPVGMFGIIGYAAIAITWFVHLLTTDAFKTYTSLIVWGLALLGVIFSIYLTFLEAFVIGATCAWCISSAIIITLLLWTATSPAIQASTSISGDDE